MGGTKDQFNVYLRCLCKGHKNQKDYKIYYVCLSPYLHSVSEWSHSQLFEGGMKMPDIISCIETVGAKQWCSLGMYRNTG